MSRANWITGALMFLLALPLLAYDENPNLQIRWLLVYRWIALPLLGCLLLRLFANLHCPACSQHLGRAFNGRFCKHCGEQLRR